MACHISKASAFFPMLSVLWALYSKLIKKALCFLFSRKNDEAQKSSMGNNSEFNSRLRAENIFLWQ